MLRRVSTGIYRALANPQSLAPASRGLKETTGLVGVEVDPNARENLIIHLNRVKELVAEKVPEGKDYRTNLEKTCDYKLNIISKVQDDQELEDVLGFQLEEEIMFCKDELGLIPKMAEWKPWDVPEGYEVPVYYEEDPMETGKWAEVVNKTPHPSDEDIHTAEQNQGPAGQ